MRFKDAKCAVTQRNWGDTHERVKQCVAYCLIIYITVVKRMIYRAFKYLDVRSKLCKMQMSSFFKTEDLQYGGQRCYTYFPKTWPVQSSQRYKIPLPHSSGIRWNQYWASGGAQMTKESKIIDFIYFIRIYLFWNCEIVQTTWASAQEGSGAVWAFWWVKRINLMVPLKEII